MNAQSIKLSSFDQIGDLVDPERKKKPLVTVKSIRDKNTPVLQMNPKESLAPRRGELRRQAKSEVRPLLDG